MSTPEQNNREIREEILINSPYTRVLLDRSMRCHNSRFWSSKVHENLQLLLVDMEYHLGANWPHLIVMPLVFYEKYLGILDPTMNNDLKFLQIRNLVASGFEMNSPLSWIFGSDFYTTLLEEGRLNPKKIKDLTGGQEVHNFINALLSSGTYLRSTFVPSSRSMRYVSKSDLKQDPLKNFIQRLDTLDSI